MSKANRHEWLKHTHPLFRVEVTLFPLTQFSIALLPSVINLPGCSIEGKLQSKLSMTKNGICLANCLSFVVVVKAIAWWRVNVMGAQ